MVEKRKIYIGTSNNTKVLEIENFFNENSINYKIEKLSKYLQIEEIGESFEEIARWKVKKYSEDAMDMMFLSDDSGLCIDCLGGRPGIFSARFPYEGVSDKERNMVMIKLLRENGDLERKATFYSAIAVGINGICIASAVGTCEGKVILESRGKNGFGFDPIFIPNGAKKTFAQMSVEEKLEISHRGKALSEIVKLLGR